MSRNPRNVATLAGISLALGFALPQTVLAQDSAAIARMKPGAGKVPAIATLNFTNTDVRSVFRLLSEYSAVDIVVDPNVNGSINTVVTNKTWQEVVHIVAKMMNLTVTNELGYLYVQKTDDYQKRLVERAAANTAQDQAAKLQRKIIRISNARADEMEKAVKDQISPRGKITVVPRTNSLILVDGPEQIAAIEKVIRQLDLETNQILIEAKLVQVESNALQELGINWSLNSGSGMGWKTAPSGLGSNGNLVGGPFKGGNATINTPASKASQGVAFGLLNGNLGVAISHLLETGKAEVLATPQITTLDNKEARIFMGDQVPIQTKDVSGNTVTTMFNAGTELVVLPQITAPDRVLLNLKPKKDNYQVVAGAGVVIRKQEAETNVVVTDGETVVIGGLVERSENKSEAGVPLLKDIPLLGVLFRYTRHELVKKDLAIFVTPRIVRRGLVPLPAPTADQDLAKAATAPSAEPPAVAAAPAPAPAPVAPPEATHVEPPPPPPAPEPVPPPPLAPPEEPYSAPVEPVGPVN
ncbi:MAG TPA: type IV pilus secretin PilQ [Fibrobacteria bacterium]|nr:type IV pilus secretin PilQ [Fibrobacteria bacterium]